MGLRDLGLEKLVFILGFFFKFLILYIRVGYAPRPEPNPDPTLMLNGLNKTRPIRVGSGRVPADRVHFAIPNRKSICRRRLGSSERERERSVWRPRK